MAEKRASRTASDRARAGRTARKAPERKPTPAQIVHESDRKFSVDYWRTDDEPKRVAFTTRLYPALIRKMDGLILLAKLTGAPKGITEMQVLITEALSRYIDTAENVDGIDIPKLPTARNDD